MSELVFDLKLSCLRLAMEQEKANQKNRGIYNRISAEDVKMQADVFYRYLVEQ